MRLPHTRKLLLFLAVQLGVSFGFAWIEVATGWDTDMASGFWGCWVLFAFYPGLAPANPKGSSHE